jgi:hypothetical protein
MTVGGNYTFDDASRLVAFANSGAGFTYWATAVFDEDNMVSVITNNVGGAEPLISVSGQLITNVSGDALTPNGTPLLDSQIGINLRNTVDGSSAIWLLHADEGIEELAARIAGLSINFCNADGSVCMDYLAAKGELLTEDEVCYAMEAAETDLDSDTSKVPGLVCALHEMVSRVTMSGQIRMLWCCVFIVWAWLEHNGIDPEAVIRAKHEYNKTRPYKHGKRY